VNLTRPVAEKFLVVTKIAFEEDRGMIESQAENILMSPNGDMNTSADLGPNLFRAALRELKKQEDAPAQKVAETL